MKITRWALVALSSLSCLGLAACGGGGAGGGISGTGAPQGTLRLALTDAPSCGYDNVYVTVQTVRVHQSASAGDADSGWSEITLSPQRRIDLNTLTNGVVEELGQTQLPAGTYTQLRLVLADNGNSAPYANAVKPTGGSETALSTPSAQQSGLKVNVNIDVPVGQVADIVLDFDACKSVVKRGNSGQYNLKPVITATPRLSDAGYRVVGYLDAATTAAGASVSLQFNGAPVKATPPDSTGRFVLYPVPVGSYDLVVTASGRVTAVMTGVPVVSTAWTFVNSTLLPITPPLAGTAARLVQGTVNPAAATVRALQTLSGGPTVEVAWAPVDALNGEFDLLLTPSAPVRTAYVVNPVVLNFVAVPATAGLYTVEARSAGVVKTQAIDVWAPVPALNFTFP